jgi:Tfp pilus assembly protein PilF
MVPVNDDEVSASNEDTVEAPRSVEPPAEAAQAPTEGVSDAAVASNKSRSKKARAVRTGADLWVNRALGAVVVAIVVLGAYFGYSYYRAQQQARLASPALQIVDQVQKLVDKSPNDATLRVRLGEALASAGDDTNAKAQLLAAVKMNPKYAGAYQDLAEIALLDKDNANAEIYLTRLLALTSTGEYQDVNDRREFALFSLGELTLEQRRWTDAIGYFNAALAIRKDASDTYLRLAQAYHGSGDDTSAMQQVNIALEFDPKYPEAHYFRGTLYLAIGDKVDAAWDFRAALDGAPDQAEAKAALASLGTFDQWLADAQAAFSSGDLTVAAGDVSIARSIQPSSYAAAMLHGRILDQQGKYSDAADAYSIAVKVNPTDKVAAAAYKAALAAAKKGSK